MVVESGIALEMWGPAAFSTVGFGVVTEGQSSAFVELPLVTGDSHVSITLVGNPGARQVSWVERTSGSGFTVHLTNAPPKQRKEVGFTWFVVQPA